MARWRLEPVGRWLPPALEVVDRVWVEQDGRRLLYFGGCDYLRLSHHPVVRRAVRSAVRQIGLNVAASRLTTGNHALYGELEQELAEFFGAEAAVVVSCGYLTNVVVAQALAGHFTHALLDSRSHACLADAARFLDCPVLSFAHRDPEALAARVKSLGRNAHVLVLTDGLFSHDGSVAPLRAYLEVLPRSAVILVDDAHGAGVLGARGRGTPEHEAVDRTRLIQTITLSKAFGAYGGAILGSRWLRQRIIRLSDVFAGNTPLPLPLAAGALAAVRLLRAQPTLRQRLHRNSLWLKDRLRALGVRLPDNPGPVVALQPSTARQANQIAGRLLAAGIYPVLIKYPGGPPKGYFRFAISSAHTRQHLNRLAEALSAALRTAS